MLGLKELGVYSEGKKTMLMYRRLEIETRCDIFSS